MKRLLTLCLLVLALPLSAGSPGIEPPPVATFSIVAIDPANGDLGIAVASRYFSVGSVVPWAMAGVGAVATQANVNVGYGQQAIDLLRQGLTAQQVLAKLLADDTFPGKDGRQVAIVDAKGNIAAHTGHLFPMAPISGGPPSGPSRGRAALDRRRVVIRFASSQKQCRHPVGREPSAVATSQLTLAVATDCDG